MGQPTRPIGGYRIGEAATLSPSDAGRLELGTPDFGRFDEVTWQMAGCFRACPAPPSR